MTGITLRSKSEKPMEMHYFCYEYDLSISTRQKNTYLINLSEKGHFSGQRQIVMGITLSIMQTSENSSFFFQLLQKISMYSLIA